MCSVLFFPDQSLSDWHSVLTLSLCDLKSASQQLKYPHLKQKEIFSERLNYFMVMEGEKNLSPPTLYTKSSSSQMIRSFLPHKNQHGRIRFP